MKESLFTSGISAPIDVDRKAPTRRRELTGLVDRALEAKAGPAWQPGSPDVTEWPPGRPPLPPSVNLMRVGQPLICCYEGCYEDWLREDTGLRRRRS